MLRIFLFGLSNRRKQPERYVKWGAKIFTSIFDKVYTKIVDINYKECTIINGGGGRAPSLGDYIFTPSSGFRSGFKLLLYLYDETWVLEHNTFGRWLCFNRYHGTYLCR
jgi:hypothetical protein